MEGIVAGPALGRGLARSFHIQTPLNAAQPRPRRRRSPSRAGAVGRDGRLRTDGSDSEAEVEEDEDDDDDWDDDSFERQRPRDRPSPRLGVSELTLNLWRQKPVEEKYRLQAERGISPDRMEELGVHHWSTWSSPGPCAYQWEWKADEQVYITRGTLRVIPFGCEDYAEFKEGDLVRFPKWMFAELEFAGNYEQRYRFRAYGDDN